MKFQKGTRANATSNSDGLEVVFDVHPDNGDRVAVDVTIRRDEQVVETATIAVKPTETASGGKYTGDPISLSLKDADLRDVIGMFGKLTSLDMKIDDDVQGKVTVNWQNIPWDKALDLLLSQNGCSYRIEGKTIHVVKN